MLTDKELVEIRDAFENGRCSCADMVGQCQNCSVVEAIGELQMRRVLDKDDLTMPELIKIVAKQEAGTLAGRTLTRAARFIEILESEIAEMESQLKAKS